MSSETTRPIYSSGKIEIRAMTIEPVHQGAFERAGNTTLIETQQVFRPDGTTARVPYITGNSIKGRLRRAMMEFTLRAMEAEDSFSKKEIDLLYSGGHLSEGGSAIDLKVCREIETLLPALSLCGYSAGNVMTESKISCQNWHVVCLENAFRMPDDVVPYHRRLAEAVHGRQALLAGADLEPAGELGQVKPAAALVKKAAGTRKDIGASHMSRYLKAEDRKLLEEGKAKRRASGKAEPRDDRTAQMIYDFQVIAPGTTMWSQIRYRDVTHLEYVALVCGFAWMTTEVLPPLAEGMSQRAVWRLGGKANVGYGAVAVDIMASEFSGIERGVPATDGEALARAGGTAGWEDPYVVHLRENRAEILDLLKRTAG